MTVLSHSPEYHNNRTLASCHDHQSLPYHQRRGNDHSKVQELIVQLEIYQMMTVNLTHQCSQHDNYGKNTQVKAYLEKYLKEKH